MLAERDRHALAAFRLLVHQHVRHEDAHLACVDLVNQGVES